MPHKYLAIFLLLLLSLCSWSKNDSSAVYNKSYVINKIDSLQCKNHVFFKDGLFRAYTYTRDVNKTRDDDLVVASANVALSLAYCKLNSDFDEKSEAMLDSMINRIRSNYWRYKNMNGGITYNSWQSHPEPVPLPNSKFPKWMTNRMMPSDDLDCTSLVYSSMPKDSALLDSIKILMAYHTNLNNGLELKVAPKKYRSRKDVYLEFYSSGIRQHVEFCSMTNFIMLSFMHELPINRYDSATINLIKEMVIDRSYIKTPYLISMGYQLPPILFYHLTRLMESGGKKYFGDIWELVIEDLNVKLTDATTRMDKLTYSLCLRRLGCQSEVLINSSLINEFSNSRMGFTSAMYSMPYWIFKKYVQSDRFSGYSVCEGFNWCVLLEYLVLNDKLTAVKN